MTGASLGLRTPSYGSLQQQGQNGGGLLQTQNSFVLRKPPKISLSGSREKERFLPRIFRYLGRRKVGMLFLVIFALMAFLSGFFTVNKEDASMVFLEDASGSAGVDFDERFRNKTYHVPSLFPKTEVSQNDNNSSLLKSLTVCGANSGQPPPPTPHVAAIAVLTTQKSHTCDTFAFPPPPPGDRRRIGPRPCPVCYVPVEQAIASMPSSPSPSPVLGHLTYFREENPIKIEPHGGSDFGGYPSLKQRNDSFNIKESMTVHCGFVKGCRPGHQTGFDIDAADLVELEQFHDVIVASAIFGNYDIIQQPKNISDTARKNIPFYMFVDEETEAYLKNSSLLDNNKRVGLWRIIVVHSNPYTDARRNGKVSLVSFGLVASPSSCVHPDGIMSK
ncbi:unnamed protein product [Ilex paraguariensis]|uniref:TOD1/MUCI70 glycosyltransferase-like domain-containing protein n=1 Tax=Ilex paraguariensis TaxID=185542 RepID=A0ABC8QZP3_9AQUA